MNQFQKEILTCDSDAYYEGFFQSIYYLNDIREKLLSDFTPKNELEESNKIILEDILNSNSVAVSVRHGIDYIDLGWNIEADYYLKAIDVLSKRITNLQFFVFSDDIEWCKKIIPNSYKITFVNSKDSNCGYTCGIYLMSKCKHNMISNSTYAWWGAWLNNNPDKIIIYPQKWIPIKSHLKTIYSELFPSSWLAID